MSINVNGVIEKVLGQTKLPKGTVTTLNAGAIRVPVYRTGIPQLDVALGVGGLPKGRIIEIYGTESSGKTTLCLSLAGQIQTQGDIVGIIDVENSLDPTWAGRCGVDIDNLILSQPDCAEDAFKVAESLIANDCNCVIIDSVSALVPKAEIDGEFGDSHMGLQARLMSQALRKLTGKAKKKNAVIVFINQIREKIGVVWGSPETTSGGRALKFYSSVRVDVRRGLKQKANKDSKDIIGMEPRIKIVKNKVAPPFKICNPVLNFESGFDVYSNVFKALIDSGEIKAKGSWYSWGDDSLGQGKSSAFDNFLEMVDDKIIDTLYNNYLVDNLNISSEMTDGKKKNTKSKKRKSKKRKSKKRKKKR